MRLRRNLRALGRVQDEQVRVRALEDGAFLRVPPVAVKNDRPSDIGSHPAVLAQLWRLSSAECVVGCFKELLGCVREF